MIDKKSLTPEWIDEVSVKHQKADKILIEKVIRAILLLEGLVRHKVNFILKGGTALMLSMNMPKRLSIDVDIVSQEPVERLNSLLEEVAKKQGFIRVEAQERLSTINIPKTHYKFFYRPSYKTRLEEESILLDILFEKPAYQRIEKVSIISPFITTKGEPEQLSIPSLEDLLGDKLTAFAPDTTGIPYYKKGDSMSMEIIKQLYDIGVLFDSVKDLEIIKKTFHAFATTELAYRNHSQKGVADVLNDISQTSLCITSRGAIRPDEFQLLQSGIQRVSRFIFSESFHLEKAILWASRAAYLASLIRNNAQSMERYTNPLQMQEWVIDEPAFPKINKLKKANPEAFFYWFKAYSK